MDTPISVFSDEYKRYVRDSAQMPCYSQEFQYIAAMATKKFLNENSAVCKFHDYAIAHMLMDVNANVGHF